MLRRLEPTHHSRFHGRVINPVKCSTELTQRVPCPFGCESGWFCWWLSWSDRLRQFLEEELMIENRVQHLLVSGSVSLIKVVSLLDLPHHEENGLTILGLTSVRVRTPAIQVCFLLLSELVEQEFGGIKKVSRIHVRQPFCDPFFGSPSKGLLKPLDRKSTRLNSSHITISYAVFCLKK